MFDYRTLYKQAEAEIIEKKSRFIGYAFPVKTADEAAEHITAVKKKHYKARHNIFAYRIVYGVDTVEKQSDDGEPSGTAGMPVLELLKKMELQDVLIAVTRYFGGILLGAGGLARAYALAAKEAVLAAGIVEKIHYRKVLIRCDYALLGKLQHEIPMMGAVIDNTAYEDNIELSVLVKPPQTGEFISRITDITSAKARIMSTEEVYTEWLDGKRIG